MNESDTVVGQAPVKTKHVKARSGLYRKACKRIRNDPFFRGWRFAFVDLDSTWSLTEECILGIIACPSWADCGSERL